MWLAKCLHFTQRRAPLAIRRQPEAICLQTLLFSSIFCLQVKLWVINLKNKLVNNGNETKTAENAYSV